MLEISEHLSIRTWISVILKLKFVLFGYNESERKTSKLVIWKARKITCISYLEVRRTRELIYLQSKGVTYISYLKLRKGCAFLKSIESVCLRRMPGKHIGLRSLAG